VDNLDGPETTEIVIFSQLKSTADSPNTIQLSVARLTQRPSLHVQKRVPRPDDPIPRQPRAFFGIAADLSSGVRLGAANAEDDRVFKVPEVPRQTKGRSKGKEKEDVFDDIAEVIRVNSVESKGGKGKHKSEEGPMLDEVAFEKANKNVSISYYFVAHHQTGERSICVLDYQTSNDRVPESDQGPNESKSIYR